MRPESMKYFDDFRNQNVLAVEHAKKNGRKVVGTYCGYAPYELILAAGGFGIAAAQPGALGELAVSSPGDRLFNRRYRAAHHKNIGFHRDYERKERVC